MIENGDDGNDGGDDGNGHDGNGHDGNVDDGNGAFIIIIHTIMVEIQGSEIHTCISNNLET